MRWWKWRDHTPKVQPSNFSEVNAAIAESEREYQRAQEKATKADEEAGKLRETTIRNGFAPLILNTLHRHQGGNA